MKTNRLSVLACTSVAMLATASTGHAALYGIDAGFANAGRFNGTFPGGDIRTLAHLARPDGSSVAIVTYDNNACPSGRHCLAIYPFTAAGQAVPPITVPTTHSFSKRTGGVVLDPFLVRTAAIDSQNRILIGGTEQLGPVFQFKVIRLLANGQPDTSFDGDGIATPGNFTGENVDLAKSMAIDSTDRVVVAGSAKYSSNDTDFAVLRLTEAGALDTSFSDDGKYTVAFDLAGAGLDSASAVAIRPGGQIYLAGSATDGSITRIGLAKVLPAGTLDTSFCNSSCSFQGPYTNIRNGKRVLFFGDAEDNLSDFVRSMDVNVSGEMVYAGSHQVGEASFTIFTQKVALNGDYAAERLIDVGLGGGLDYATGGIRYFNRNSGSTLVLTGAVGPGREFFFAQGLSGALVPLTNWGSNGTNSSVVLYTASGAFGDDPGDLPAIPSVDTSARVLLGGSYKATSVDPNYSLNVMRLSPTVPADLIFRSGFE